MSVVALQMVVVVVVAVVLMAAAVAVVVVVVVVVEEEKNQGKGLKGDLHQEQMWRTRTRTSSQKATYYLCVYVCNKSSPSLTSLLVIV